MDHQSTAAGELGVDDDRLLSYGELASYAGVPERTMRHWVNTGRGPIGVQLGKHMRFRVADIRAWIRAQKVVA